MARERLDVKLVRVRDFCRILGLPPSTVYRMVETGRLKAVRVEVGPANPKGVVRIPVSEIDRLLSTGAEGKGKGREFAVEPDNRVR